MKNLVLQIEDMSCGHCLNAVNQALGKLAGVRPVSVRIGRADLEYEESVITPTAIVEAVGAAGYRATPMVTP